MKTSVKTTIKGSENLFVKESVDVLFEALINKNSFMLVTIVKHNGTEKRAIIKKSSIKMIE